MTPIGTLPTYILDNYEVHEWRHACAVLRDDFQQEWQEIVHVLMEFTLPRSFIMRPGGNISPISETFNSAFLQFGWIEKGFDTQIVVDANIYNSPTHKVDCFKNQVALEIEWNNKDPFYDRDLNNFRLLFGVCPRKS